MKVQGHMRWCGKSAKTVLKQRCTHHYDVIICTRLLVLLSKNTKSNFLPLKNLLCASINYTSKNIHLVKLSSREFYEIGGNMLGGISEDDALGMEVHDNGLISV